MAGEHILVVDSGMSVQELCRSVLEREGYRVTTVSNAAAALVCPELASVDLLLLNSSLAGVSSEDLIRLLRSSEQTILKPVVLMIPDTNIPTTSSVDELSIQGWLQVPFVPSILIKKIALVLESRRLLQHERDYLREQALQMTRGITAEALAEGVNTHIRTLLDQASQQIQDELKKLVTSQLDGTALELTAEKMQQVVENVTRTTAKEHLAKISDEVARASINKLLVNLTQAAVTESLRKQLPDMARAAVVERADRELPNMVQEGVQKAAEMIVPLTSEKALSIMEGVANRMVPNLVREAVEKATEHYVTDKLARDIPQRVSALVGTAVNDEVKERISPLTTKVIRITGQRIFLFSIMILVLVAGMIFAGIVKVSKITEPVIEMQQQDLKGDNPFDWLLK